MYTQATAIPFISTSDDNKYDYRFYENGKIGLKDENGSIRFPAIYDCKGLAQI